MILTYVLTTAFCLVVLFGGFYSRVALGNNIETSDLALMEYVVWAFPSIIAALMGVVILAAAMSTTDGLLVAISTVFAYDVYLKVFVKRGFCKLYNKKSHHTELLIRR